MKKFFIGIIILLLMLINTIVYATGFNLDNVLNGGKDFSNSAISNAGDVNGQFSGLIKGLAQAGLAIGTIIAIVGGIIISIKLMSDGANGKAELKESLTPYLIGCVVLFGAFGIWTAVVNIMEGTFITNAPGGGGGGGVAPPAVTPSVVAPPVTPIYSGEQEQQLVNAVKLNSGHVKILVNGKTITTVNLNSYAYKESYLNKINQLCSDYSYTREGN